MIKTKKLSKDISNFAQARMSEQLQPTQAGISSAKNLSQVLRTQLLEQCQPRDLQNVFSSDPSTETAPSYVDPKPTKATEKLNFLERQERLVDEPQGANRTADIRQGLRHFKASVTHRNQSSKPNRAISRSGRRTTTQMIDY
jgi:hypothetical protein